MIRSGATGSHVVQAIHFVQAIHVVEIIQARGPMRHAQGFRPIMGPAGHGAIGPPTPAAILLISTQVHGAAWTGKHESRLGQTRFG